MICMNKPTVNGPNAPLLLYLKRVSSILWVILLLMKVEPAQAQDPLREIIEDNRKHIDDLTRQLWDSKKKIAILAQRNNNRSHKDAIIAEELYMLQQGVHDLSNRLKKLRSVLAPPTNRSAPSPEDIRKYLDQFEYKMVEIEETLQRINKTSALIKAEIPTYDLTQENIELIKNSFRLYYATYPGPSSQLIRLDRAYAKDVRQLYLEFNVRDKQNAYTISLQNASGYEVPNFRGEMVSLTGKLAWKRKSCQLGPGRYTITVNYRGKVFRTYSFSLM